MLTTDPTILTEWNAQDFADALGKLLLPETEDAALIEAGFEDDRFPDGVQPLVGSEWLTNDDGIVVKLADGSTYLVHVQRVR